MKRIFVFAFFAGMHALCATTVAAPKVNAAPSSENKTVTSNGIAPSEHKQPKDEVAEGTRGASNGGEAKARGDGAPSIDVVKESEVKAAVDYNTNNTKDIGLVANTSSASGELSVVSHVDLGKYVGAWHEIARFDNEHQEGCVFSQAMYTQKKEYIEVKNSCTLADGQKKEAIGRLKTPEENSGNAKLKVNFTPFFIRLFGVGWGDYWIIDLGSNYEYAVVSGPSKERLWILSRQIPMKKSTYDDIVKRLKEKGFDTSKLVVGKNAVAES